MSNPFINKLQGVVPLSGQDRSAIMSMCTDVRKLPANTHIVRRGIVPRHVHLILEGWAASYQVLDDGSRQITAFLLPGDLCDQYVQVLGDMDHSTYAITDATVAYLPLGELDKVASERPHIARALWWSTLEDESILRTWLVSVGRRDAYAGISHLLCELHARLWNIGLVGDHHFALPLTQEEIADALGLTPVHVSRTLKRLRQEGLVTLTRRILTIPEVAKLRAVAGFNEGYLNGRRRAEASL